MPSGQRSRGPDLPDARDAVRPRRAVEDDAGVLTVSPERIGAMTAAALVILHTEHHRTG